jgi:hypothetical protein
MCESPSHQSLPVRSRDFHLANDPFEKLSRRGVIACGHHRPWCERDAELRIENCFGQSEVV